jgi:hypothetical protein
MLEIMIPANELFIESTQSFVTIHETTIRLEHSLVAISKWESKWHKPFLDKNDKTNDELIDYIRCMCITQNVASETFYALTKQNMADVSSYINDPMTATTIKHTGRVGRDIVTSEIIYYWMVTYNIPFECQKWHINRLLTLIDVCNAKSQPSKTMNKKSIMASNAAINAERRARMHSKG